MSDYQLSEACASFLKKETFNAYINNNYVSTDSGKFLDLIDPATESVIGKMGIANADTANEAVNSSHAAFRHHSWKQMPPADRELLMYRLADKIEEHLLPLAELLTLENGKLLAQAKGEIIGAAQTFRYYAGWCTKIEGETIDVSLKQKPGKQNFAFTKRVPVGVVAAIVPWNFPISIASWKLAPALAAGCTVVLKPSEVTPLATLYMAELFAEVGFPAGVLNIVLGDGSTGAALTGHPLVSKITFTGSTQVGRLIGKAAMDNLTDISLELGGKSPGIVFEDANLDEAAKGIAAGIFRNGGQVCVAGSRLYIQKKIYDKLLSDICTHGENMKISHGFDPDADLGPLVSKEHLKRVCDYIDIGNNEGASLKTGGSVVDRKGYYLKPTVFAAEKNDYKIISDEIFGPVLVAVPFDDMEDALTKANDNQYGLSSTVWTKNIDKAMHCVNELEAGWVFVNGPARSDPNFPIGGFKQSGIGKELGKVGLYNYTKLKSVNIIY